MCCGPWTACRRQGAYLEALRLDPKLALANAHLGLVLQREGQLADALVWLKKAVELEPDKRQLLGSGWPNCTTRWKSPASRFPCWERVLALEPGAVGAASFAWAGHCKKKAAWPRLPTHYHAALELQPDTAPPI